MHPRQGGIKGEEQDDHLTDKVMKQTNDETRSKGRPSILLLRSNRFPMRGPLGSNKNSSTMIMGVKFYFIFSDIGLLSYQFMCIMAFQSGKENNTQM